MTQYIADEKIDEYIKKLGMASVNEIRRAFDISESTVRRTLARLESTGHIRRYKGGAVSLNHKSTMFDQRLQYYSTEKDTIARKATECIKEGSSIILLGGTTISAMCPYLFNKNLTVITNSLAVVDALKNASGVQLIMLGGIYHQEEYELVGDVTSMGLQVIHADILFTGCTGFSPEIGFMTDEINSISFYNLCMKSADKTYVLADSSKSQKSSMAIFAPGEKVHGFITDNGIPESIKTAFINLGIDMIIAT